MPRLNGTEQKRLRTELLVLTGDDFAARAGVSTQVILDIEVGYRPLRGKRVETRVHEELLRKLAEVPGVTATSLNAPEATGLS